MTYGKIFHIFCHSNMFKFKLNRDLHKASDHLRDFHVMSIRKEKLNKRNN
jgi:hypothetical protein